MVYSKMVTRRQGEAATVVQAAFTHADAVGAALERTLVPALPGTAGESFTELIRRLGRTLKASIDALVAADMAHEAEKADDRPVRRELDESAAALYREVVDLRRAVEAVGGARALALAGLTGITTREHTALLRLGQDVQDRLPVLASEIVPRRGLSFDVSACAGPLAAATDRMERAQHAWLREVREREVTLMHKNEAMAAYDACYQEVAGALEALFRLAGLGELADRVRPPRRRRKRDQGASATPATRAPGAPSSSIAA
jgi:hypothetical protein